LARRLRGNIDGQPQPLRKIAAYLAERSYVTPSGRPYSASAIASMLGEGIHGAAVAQRKRTIALESGNR
jgi:hypothetical protein